MNFLKSIVALIGALVFSSAVWAADSAGASSLSVYPIQDPLIATITSAINHTDVPYKIIKVEPLPQRRTVPLLENMNHVALSYFSQPNPKAPLAFVISGVGGSGLSGSSLLIAGDLNKQGFAVVTLPDPVNWQYVLGVSRSGVPGYLPQDVKEYYAFMKFVLKNLKSTQGIKPTQFSVIGYSYGALLTGYLMKEDNSQKFFNFEKAVLINPAVDLNHGVKTLDGFYAAGNNLTAEQKDFIKGSLLNIGSELLSGPGTMQDLLSALQTVPPYTVKHRDWLVGDSFREDLRDVVFATQQIHDIGLLKKKMTNHHRNARLEEAKTVSFMDYIVKVVLPPIQKKSDTPITTDQLIASGGLYPLMDMFANDPRIYMQENANDFLLHDGDLDLLKKTFGDRLRLYPFGGHIGGLWFPKNRMDLGLIMAAPAQ